MIFFVIRHVVIVVVVDDGGGGGGGNDCVDPLYINRVSKESHSASSLPSYSYYLS